MIDIDLLKEKFPLVFEYFNWLGLSVDDFRVYMTLYVEGRKRASELSSSLDVDRAKVYRILDTLQKVPAVEITGGRPAYYSAVPIEEFLSKAIFHKEQEVKDLKLRVNDVLEDFKSKISLENGFGEEKPNFRFRFIQGENALISQAKEVVNKTENDLRIAVDKFTFLKFYRSEIVKEVAKCASRGISVKILSEADDELYRLFRKIRSEKNVKFFNYSFYPVFLISDKKEIITLIETGNRNMKLEAGKGPLGFWCTSLPFSTRMNMLFDFIWDEFAETREINHSES